MTTKEITTEESEEALADIDEAFEHNSHLGRVAGVAARKTKATIRAYVEQLERRAEDRSVQVGSSPSPDAAAEKAGR